ncbi:MAG: hypothetical protein AMJ69_00910 [Gammaproteobacteria bacterium SG8_47]|nr:MAG: hypothetical protein AMJ69_00910 [Gammaproteobacteria bacterium SG8_47]
MYTLEELQEQNNEISALCNVLAVLLEHPELRTNAFVCELLKRFREKVWMHLVFEDNPIYSELARHPDQAFSAVAEAFHDSAKEIRKRFAHYVKHACDPAAEQDLGEARAIIALIRERLAYESEQVFPLVRAHQQAGWRRD